MRLKICGGEKVVEAHDPRPMRQSSSHDSHNNMHSEQQLLEMRRCVPHSVCIQTALRILNHNLINQQQQKPRHSDPVLDPDPKGDIYIDTCIPVMSHVNASGHVVLLVTRLTLVDNLLSSWVRSLHSLCCD